LRRQFSSIAFGLNAVPSSRPLNIMKSRQHAYNVRCSLTDKSPAHAQLGSYLKLRYWVTSCLSHYIPLGPFHNEILVNKLIVSLVYEI